MNTETKAGLNAGTPTRQTPDGGPVRREAPAGIEPANSGFAERSPEGAVTRDGRNTQQDGASGSDVGGGAGAPAGDGKPVGMPGGPAPAGDAWTALRAQRPAVAYLLYFPAMRDVARAHGYALAIHGSLTRDFDLVAVPWTPEASDADTLVAAICADNQLLVTVPDKGDKPHGRRCWTLQGISGLGHGWVDLSVMPRMVSRG